MYDVISVRCTCGILLSNKYWQLDILFFVKFCHFLKLAPRSPCGNVTTMLQWCPTVAILRSYYRYCTLLFLNIYFVVTAIKSSISYTIIFRNILKRQCNFYFNARKYSTMFDRYIRFDINWKLVSINRSTRYCRGNFEIVKCKSIDVYQTTSLLFIY